jgi:hypothetical protein
MLILYATHNPRSNKKRLTVNRSHDDDENRVFWLCLKGVQDEMVLNRLEWWFDEVSRKSGRAGDVSVLTVSYKLTQNLGSKRRNFMEERRDVSATDVITKLLHQSQPPNSTLRSFHYRKNLISFTGTCGSSRFVALLLRSQTSIMSLLYNIVHPQQGVRR